MGRAWQLKGFNLIQTAPNKTDESVATYLSTNLEFYHSKDDPIRKILINFILYLLEKFSSSTVSEVMISLILINFLQSLLWNLVSS